MTYTLTRTNVRANPPRLRPVESNLLHGPALSAPETRVTRQRQNYHRVEPWSGREGPCLSGQDCVATPRGPRVGISFFFLLTPQGSLPRPMLCMIPTGLDWLCYGRAASRRNQHPGARGGVSTTLTHTLLLYPTHPPPGSRRPGGPVRETRYGRLLERDGRAGVRAFVARLYDQ